MPSQSLSVILIISALLSLAAIAIIPIYHEASAKVCNNTDDSGGSSCSDDKQDSNSNDDDHEHSDHSAKKDKTPFVLSTPVPFP